MLALNPGMFFFVIFHGQVRGKLWPCMLKGEKFRVQQLALNPSILRVLFFVMIEFTGKADEETREKLLFNPNHCMRVVASFSYRFDEFPRHSCVIRTTTLLMGSIKFFSLRNQKLNFTLQRPTPLTNLQYHKSQTTHR